MSAARGKKVASDDSVFLFFQLLDLLQCIRNHIAANGDMTAGHGAADGVFDGLFFLLDDLVRLIGIDLVNAADNEVDQFFLCPSAQIFVLADDHFIKHLRGQFSKGHSILVAAVADTRDDADFPRCGSVRLLKEMI